jgi:hypothetical protein
MYIVLNPAQENFTLMEASQLPVEDYKIKADA